MRPRAHRRHCARGAWYELISSLTTLPSLICHVRLEVRIVEQWAQRVCYVCKIVPPAPVPVRHETAERRQRGGVT